MDCFCQFYFIFNLFEYIQTVKLESTSQVAVVQVMVGRYYVCYKFNVN